VTVLAAGTCELTATHPGDAVFHPAEPVTASFEVLPATLTVRGSRTTVTYDGTVPQLVPVYGEFRNGDDASDLDVQATCTSTALADGLPGVYPVTCSGASDLNYSFAYISGGRLQINPAATTLTLAPESGAMQLGERTTLTATVRPTGTNHGPGPTGTVRFTSVGRSLPGCATPRPVNPATGTASCVVSSLPPGTQVVHVVYSGDGRFSESELTRNFVVADIAPPVLSLRPTTSFEVLPAAGQSFIVDARLLVLSAVDSFDRTVDPTDVVVDRVTSDEPAAITFPEGSCTRVSLPRERDARGNGRVYTVTLRVRDAAGNTATRDITVYVPTAQGRPAVADAPVTTVNSPCA
jgi:hypothetical protein